MAVKDAPDYTLWMAPVIPVGGDAVPESPDLETPILETEGKVTTTETTYQTLATWTVTAAKAGVLRCLELDSDDFAHSLFKITMKGVVKETDWEIQKAWTGFFAECRLEAADVILLEGKSSDGTSVSLWGVIDGKEVG